LYRLEASFVTHCLRRTGSTARVKSVVRLYAPIWGGFLCLAVVLDASSRRIVGWAMSNDPTSRLVLDALETVRLFMPKHDFDTDLNSLSPSARSVLGLRWVMPCRPISMSLAPWRPRSAARTRA
jgi:hypothetical protein